MNLSYDIYIANTLPTFLIEQLTQIIEKVKLQNKNVYHTVLMDLIVEMKTFARLLTKKLQGTSPLAQILETVLITFRDCSRANQLKNLEDFFIIWTTSNLSKVRFIETQMQLYQVQFFLRLICINSEFEARKTSTELKTYQQKYEDDFEKGFLMIKMQADFDQSDCDQIFNEIFSRQESKSMLFLKNCIKWCQEKELSSSVLSLKELSSKLKRKTTSSVMSKRSGFQTFRQESIQMCWNSTQDETDQSKSDKQALLTTFEFQQIKGQPTIMKDLNKEFSNFDVKETKIIKQVSIQEPSQLSNSQLSTRLPFHVQIPTRQSQQVRKRTINQGINATYKLKPNLANKIVTKLSSTKKRSQSVKAPQHQKQLQFCQEVVKQLEKLTKKSIPTRNPELLCPDTPENESQF